MRIVLTAGHSNTDPGAVAPGATEAAEMTSLRNALARKLRDLGHTVFTDGEGGVNQSLNDALALIRKHQPDLALELHMNAAANAALRQPALQARLRELGVHPLGGTPQQLQQMVERTTVQVRQLVVQQKVLEKTD